MSSDERIRVLNMVAAGTISPGEADEVLAALDAPPPTAEPAFAGATLPPVVRGRAPKESKRTLVIDISEGEKSLCVRIPLGLEQEQSELLLRPANGYLERYDIHLKELLGHAPDFPSGSTLLNMSEDELSIEINIE